MMSENIEKPAAEHIVQVETKERVPGHNDYYEAGGLRTYGDGMDHEHEPRVCVVSTCLELWLTYD